MKSETIFNCFRHCKICSTEEPVIDASEECPLNPEVIEDLESQIRNMLNYPKEQVTAYTLDVEVKDDEADDSQELFVVSATEAYRMVEMLERFWMQQDNSGIPFIAASQKMKDSVSMIRTKQLVQRNIDSFFQRI
ncbi:hypothetical protein CY35_03G036300 [Sphagnum magellanicum]|nr:hypothetical protein CY35_03G036300 [Sphagnum magellanicum]